MLTPWRKANNYIGEDYSDYYVVLFQYRDSGTLERSNFSNALEELGGENSPNVIIARSSHWAVGWVEHLLIHKEDKKHIEEAEKIIALLEDYPVLNEGHFSELEWEVLVSNIKEVMKLALEKECSDSLAKNIATWLHDNDYEDDIVDYDGHGAWPSYRSIEAALQSIGVEKLSSQLFYGEVQ